MTNLTLKQLRYFDAVARHAHFGRAADACAISQPALSMQIKEMEDTLGVVLVERGARQVRLTTVGEEVARRVRDILGAVNDLADLTRVARDGMVGRLRLGVIPTIAPYLLPSLIEKLGRYYPGLDVHIRETQTQTLIRELKDGRLDTAIVALPISEPSLTEVALFDEPFVLVRPAGDADEPVPGVEALRTMHLLLLEEGHCFRDQALAFCNMPAGMARDGLDASSLSTLVQMVGANLGVTLIPDMAVAVETRSAAVSVARFPAPQPSRTIGLIWRASSPLATQFRHIADVVREAAAELRAGVEVES